MNHKLHTGAVSPAQLEKVDLMCNLPAQRSTNVSLFAGMVFVAVALCACVGPGADHSPVRGQALEARADSTQARLAERISDRWRKRLQTARIRHESPGISVAAILPSGVQVTCAVGYADQDHGIALEPSHRMLSGSIGKTYVAALAVQLIQQGRLNLDRSAIDYLPRADWLLRSPGAGEATIRQLLRHESGLPRWVFARDVMQSIVNDPKRKWTDAERIETITDRQLLFQPGEGWAYADTNYIVIGAVLERILGEDIETLIRKRILEPEGLYDTIPLNGQAVPRLAQGHVVTSRTFGVPTRLLKGGEFTVNVQFEGCGGGWASTPMDLARWARALWSGRHHGEALLGWIEEGVPAESLGAGVRYGLGVMLEDTVNGPLAFHDGFQFGFLSSAGYYKDLDLAIAVQLDTDDLRAPGGPVNLLLQDLATIASFEMRRLEAPRGL
ncbi:MAG: serine hydrolase domain-containing protein [bacterium]